MRSGMEEEQAHNDICTTTTAMILRDVFAEITGNEAVRNLPLTIRVCDDPTASNTIDKGQSVISMPHAFAGVDVMKDPEVMLGLATHELCHIPNLSEALDAINAPNLRKGARTVINLLEDIRIEAAAGAHEVVNNWLTKVRTLAQAEGNDKTDLFSLLCKQRFAQPEYPFSNIVDDTQDDSNLRSFMWNMVNEMYAAADAEGIDDIIEIANSVLDTADNYGIEVPEDPPGGGPNVQLGDGVDGDELADLLGLPEGEGIKPGDGDIYTMGKIDHEALTSGKRLARTIARGWRTTEQTKVAIGAGRYDPKLECRSALAPFSMKIGGRKTLPKKMLLLVDISTSMNNSCRPGEKDNLHKARTAAVAVSEAARAIDGTVVTYLFNTKPVLVETYEKLCSISGGGTNMPWLTDMAKRYSDYDIVILTDGQVDSPKNWTPAMKARTTILAIKLEGYGIQCADIARRLQIIERGSDIGLAVAQAANKVMGGVF